MAPENNCAVAAGWRKAIRSELSPEIGSPLEQAVSKVKHVAQNMF
jgi:hypothetical protein